MRRGGKEDKKKEEGGWGDEWGGRIGEDDQKNRQQAECKEIELAPLTCRTGCVLLGPSGGGDCMHPIWSGRDDLPAVCSR